MSPRLHLTDCCLAFGREIPADFPAVNVKPAWRQTLVGSSFYFILFRISFNFGSTFSCSNSFSVNFNEFSKDEQMFSGCKSDVTVSYAEYHVESISFSRLLVGLSQYCVLSIVILISQSKYFWTFDKLWWAWANSPRLIRLLVVSKTFNNDSLNHCKFRFILTPHSATSWPLFRDPAPSVKLPWTRILLKTCRGQHAGMSTSCRSGILTPTGRRRFSLFELFMFPE